MAPWWATVDMEELLESITSLSSDSLSRMLGRLGDAVRVVVLQIVDELRARLTA